MPSRSSLQDPLKVFRFTVEVEGFARYGFMSANGLEATTEVAEYAEGGANETNRKSAGRTSYGNIVLSRGQIIDPDGQGDEDFYTWFLQVFSVKTEGFADSQYRRSMSIVQYNRDGTEARRWILRECWPCRYKATSDFNATGSDDSIEEIEICHEGWELEDGPQPAPRGGSLSPQLGIG